MQRDQRFNSQRNSSQQKRQHPIHDFQEYSFQNDILNVEKLKLQEQLDYCSMKLRDQQNETQTLLSRKDQDILNLKMQIAQMESINTELMQRLQQSKKSEEYLTNANHHVTALQRKLDQANQESQQLKNQIQNLQQQNLQLSNKWQKCSAQLKLYTTQKMKNKDYEDQLQRKIDELHQIKEKYVATTMELTVLKQSEQEYKHSVQQRVKMLVDQLKESEQHRAMLQQLLSEPRPTHDNEEDGCQQCQELFEQNEELRQKLETFEIVQLNQQQNGLMKREINQLQQKVMNLQDQNAQLSQQLDQLQQSTISEENLLSSIKTTIPQEVGTNKTSEFMNYMRNIELYVDDLGVQNRLKDSFLELQNKMEQQMAQTSQLYDRLLVKYYSLMKQFSTKQNSYNEYTEQKRQSEATPKKYEDDYPQHRYLNQSLDSIGTDLKGGKKPFKSNF